MKKILILSILVSLSSIVAHGQPFKNGKRTYNKIIDSWNSTEYELFLKKYPKSKYYLEISRRNKCLERNRDFFSVLKNIDTASMKMYLENYNSCTFCQFYLPNKSLKNLGPILNDQKIVKDSLNSLRAIYFWQKQVVISSPLNYQIMKTFVERFPTSYIVNQATDSLKIRKDNYFWNLAKVKDNSQFYKTYTDSVENGKHFKEANDKYNEYLLGEKYSTSTSHKELTVGLSILRTINSKSKFEQIILSKLQEIEYPEFTNCVKKKNITSWFEFERNYNNGYYFKEADNYVRRIANIKPNVRRSPYLTLISITNSNDFEEKLIISKEGIIRKELNLNSKQTEYFFLPNGVYKMKTISKNPKVIGIDDTVIYDGTVNSTILKIEKKSN